jgi:hypothetical protein
LAKANHRVVQKRRAKQANNERRPVDFYFGDSVYLSKKGFATTALTTRLESQSVGPYQIKKEVGFSYELDMPITFRGRNLFHADRLRKAPNNPLPQQYQEPPPPEEINGDPQWVVTRVRASRLHGKTKTLQYQVDWQGCDPDETFYPASNFKNAAATLESFYKQYPDAAGPPRCLEDWILAAAEDRDDLSHVDDDMAEHGEMNTRRRRLRRHT